MRPLIAMLAFALLAACVTPEQRAAEQRRQSAMIDAAIMACARSGHPIGTAENVNCAYSLMMLSEGGGSMTGADAAYGAYMRGWSAGNRLRSGIPEPEQRLIISPY